MNQELIITVSLVYVHNYQHNDDVISLLGKIREVK